MPRKVRSSQAKQSQAQRRAVDHESEKEQKYLGSAKVDLVHLTFDEMGSREDDEQNEKFLIDSFHRNGCVPLDPMFHVMAIIEDHDFGAALSRCSVTSDMLLDRNPAHLPMLTFSEGFQLRCLFGRHRIKAAKKVLSRSSRWWIVSLYSNDLSPQLRSSLTHQGTNEKPPNQGEVFYHILRSRILLDPVSEDFWWTRLHSHDQRCEAERLLSRRDYQSVLGSLSDIRPLFLDFRTGMIGTILRLKSDDEVLHGFGSIGDSWTFVLGGQRASLARIDRHDIKTLELRCPAICISDRDFLEPLFRTGKVLRRFSASERDQIWQRLLEHKAFIPSFYSFFENLKYLMAIAGCLKELVSLEYRQTMADAFEKAFHKQTSLNYPEMRGNVAYRHLVLYVMQQLALLDPESILVDGESKVTLPVSTVAMHELAALAHQLGFRSTQIADALSQDPDQTTARQALLAARASVATDCSELRMEPYIERVAALFKDFRQNTIAAPNPALLCSGSGEKLNRRRGCPLKNAQEQSCQSLTLAHVHVPDPVENGEPTAFFVRRDIYFFFFGKLDPGDSEAFVQSSLNPRAELLPSPSLHSFGHGAFDEAALTVDRGRQEVETSGSPEVVESVYTDASIPLGDDPSPRDHTDNDNGTVSRCVRFVMFDQGIFRVVHEELVDDRDNNDKGKGDRVELVAADFMRQGLVLMDSDTRTLAPSQCFRSALNDRSLAVYLVPEVDMSRVPEMERKIAGTKRRASDELMAESRPHKVQVTGNAPLQYLIAKNSVW